jgi:hypothetical protein
MTNIFEDTKEQAIKHLSLTVLCCGLSEALLKDELEFEEQGGYDISGGMYGVHVSNWLRLVADRASKASS